ncbi:Dam family site-specific DNA-(adenine-N6)-methyltransferase [candidate division KSB3 bacterium]|uniref:Site-specific DNA-methyltransferase (adenine-specific) n=1 Tax=candidate division KSB3 bacterium TaxID=2044937 RepID=A0A9D5JYW3_9BACT|nr:Dam family site-specific DNA-(adenine-N6)-methyltransferase [candidate division KSB3 bacterium]MBD3326291.1 Dam family site-specific DNA-(adenine-N6)-methyltransferase [candidate division KSB3 bacterium]
MKIPHPIPYQGSKRNLAHAILSYFPRKIDTLFEPFTGSAAISLAAATQGLAKHYYLNDLNAPLMELWKAIIHTPDTIARQYEQLWKAQQPDKRQYYNIVRQKFNTTHRPEYFLYLLARCVKASVRYNAQGEFNQSPDNRRKGMAPKTMRLQIQGASSLLKGRTTCSSRDYRDVIQKATPADLIYMDPPYQGVCKHRDPRYFSHVPFHEFVDALAWLNARNIRFLVSYDGRTGIKVHGRELPGQLNLLRVELHAGRSTQATLLGKTASTYESLYLSPALAHDIEIEPIIYENEPPVQMCLLETTE